MGKSSSHENQHGFQRCCTLIAIFDTLFATCRHLGLCFNHTFPVLRSLSRYKHWFQYDDVTIPANTLSIAIFRDPITWTWAMKSVPHHASDHIDLPWKTFVTKEWTTKRMFKDEAWKDNQLANNKTGRICQERFHYHEVVSCLTRPYPEGYWGPHRKHRFSQHQPFYEMKVNYPGTETLLGTRYAAVKFQDTFSWFSLRNAACLALLSFNFF